VSVSPISSDSGAEVAAGYLAAASIFASAIGIAWHPLRLVIASTMIALVAAMIGGRHTRLAFAAVVFAAFAFFAGMTVAVITSNPIW
jgi:hypothetical protein